LLAAVALAGAAWAAPVGCVEAAPAARLVSVINAGEAAFRAVDRAASLAAEAQAATLLSCLGRPLERGEAGRVRRMEAIGRFLSGDRDGSRDAWRAAKRADPGVQPAAGPIGHPLLEDDVRSMSTAADMLRAVPLPSELRLWVDGLDVRQVPVGRPFVAWTVTTVRS
jgi:hypothetical protein